MTNSPRRTAAVLALLLPLTAAGLAQPATAGPTSSTSNDVVYTQTNVDFASSVLLRDLLTKAQSTVFPASIDTDFDTPELSATGDKVVASYNRFTATTDVNGITVASRNGSGRVNLTAPDLAATASFDVEPTFSPDGQTVLFTRVTDTTPTAVDPTYTYTLFTVPVTGVSPAVALPGGDDAFAGSYKPGDANTIVFSRVTDQDTGYGTLTVLSGGVATALNATGGYVKYSPNGSTLAYSTMVSTTAYRIATIPAAPGGTETQFPAVAGGVADAAVTAWLPDGESILFDLFTPDNGRELWAVDVRGIRSGSVVASTPSTEASGGHVNGPAPTNVSASTTSTFVPVTPTRLLDTRTANGGHLGKVAQANPVTLQVTGRVAGTEAIPTTASAVVLTVTAVDGTTPTVVRVFPAPATPLPATSSLNTIRSGQVLANQVTVRLPASGAGADAGKVVLYNGAGSVHLVADVAGYYVPGPAQQRFAPLEPRRLLDTRNGTGAPRALVGQRGFVDLDVVGDALPVSGGGTVAVPVNATAVVLNVTGTAPSTTTNVKVYPTPASGTAIPNVSNLNLVRGETAPNLVTVAIGFEGKVRLFNTSGAVHLIADIAGYYAPNAPGLYQPVNPLRFLDTRSGAGAAPIATTAGGFVDLLVRNTRGVPADALAVVLNLTGTATSTPTIVRAYPATSAVPTVSNLNLIKGDSRANAVVVVPGTNGRVRLLNGAGTMQLVADLAGYFVPVPAA